MTCPQRKNEEIDDLFKVLQIVNIRLRSVYELIKFEIWNNTTQIISDNIMYLTNSNPNVDEAVPPPKTNRRLSSQATSCRYLKNNPGDPETTCLIYTAVLNTTSVVSVNTSM